VNPDQQTIPQGASLSVNDVIYILLRHKWKIVAFTLLGVLAATAVWLKKQPLFESRAKILVRYVAERRAVNTAPGDSDIVRDVELRGTAVLNSEVEILTSADCILEAVQALGAGQVLQAYDGGTNDYDAVGLLMNQLSPKVGSSGVITVTLAHRDPVIARKALEQIIEAYRRKHVKVHRATESYDDLQSEADSLRTRLTQTEQQLKEEKIKANVINLEEAKEDVSMQLSALRTAIFSAEAELAERRAELALYDKRAPQNSDAGSSTNANTTNEVAAIPEETLKQYRALNFKLAELQKRELELLSGPYAETSRSVTHVRDQIKETQNAIAALGISPADVSSPAFSPVPLQAGIPPYDYAAARARVDGLEARVEQLKQQRTEVQDQAKRIEISEDKILVLERQKQFQEAKLRTFESNLDKARLDRALDSSKITNINVVEVPTPAGRDMMKLYKMMGMALFGMIGAGIGLAFVTEMFLDRSIKRPKEVEGKAHIPLFVSIPRFGRNGRSKLKMKRVKGAVIDHASGLIKAGEIPPWESNDPMFQYYEAIRDRLVMSYANDAHKPKIVAVTSCNKGAGTTRVATGLAAALSRDVQRHVLYIGLEKNKVSVSAFHKGRPQAEFSPPTPEEETSSHELLPPDLYTLSKVGHRPEGTSIVQTFCDMIPRLRTSDYDYIIFDLPPVSETSGSLRLASQMERTLLVIESEETQKAKVDRVRDLLAESDSRLFGVLNKTRSYGPAFVNDDE
jgi:succinoglycan biosynthesis transport protein ExoP